HLPAYLLSASALIAAPACASGGYYGQRPGYSYNYERIAYQNGYDRGVRNGERDARDRRDFSYSRDGEYRDADWGYRRNEMDRYQYQRAFRRGFESGYTEAFNRVARAYGSAYPGYGYPSQGPVVPRGGFGYGKLAWRIGYLGGIDTS